MFPDNLSDLTSDALRRLASEGRAALTAFAADTAPDGEALASAETTADGVRRVEAELTARADIDARAEALRSEFTVEPEVETEEVAETEEPTEEVVAEAEPPAEPVVEVPVVEAAAPVEAPAVVTPVAASLDTTAVAGNRPAVVPGTSASRVTITASSDVPGYATGGAIADFEHLAAAVADKFSKFPEPRGNGGNADWRTFGTAVIDKNIPDKFTIRDFHTPEQVTQIMQAAANEKDVNGTGQSLVASGGWCAPSEVVYDLCESESLDGIYSLPEIAVGRGGVKFTMGPDWSDIYGSAGFFNLTEAQAIAGSPTKPCFEVTCPSFSDVRLNAVGFCLRAPILTNAAYPELIQRWLRGYLVAHQHKKNATRLTAMATALGTAVLSIVAYDGGAVTASLFNTLDYMATRARQVRALPAKQLFECILPEAAKPILRADFNLRTGKEIRAVTDADILGYFASMNIAATFVRDWQPMSATNPPAFPATFQVMLFKAGTFVEGTSNVLSLSTMYDAASLAGNTYQAGFFEEGQSIMKMCYGGELITVQDACASGRTGAANLTCA